MARKNKNAAGDRLKHSDAERDINHWARYVDTPVYEQMMINMRKDWKMRKGMVSK